jgi:hypothetical protein
MTSEAPFVLPVGYRDEHGVVHREGVMRPATAIDEIEPLADARVRANQAYVTILLLSRVVTRLGPFSPPPPAVIERLYSTDFAYLQDLYIRINAFGDSSFETECPSCHTRFALDFAAAAP